MTRETKIGLLVGLAFTILIGILLTEHLSSVNDPQPAPTNGSGANVRDGVVSPGAADDGPPISIAGTPVESPRQPVPTNVDLHPPVAYVPGHGRATQRQGRAPAGAPTPLAAGEDPAFDGSSTPPDDRAGNSTQNLSRAGRDLVREHPDDLVPYNPNASAPPANPATPVRPATAYVAVAGDSVSRIAARQMGGNTRANRDLLVRANPLLQNEGNVVVIGRTYMIPKTSSTVPGASTSAGTASSPAPRGTDAPDAPRSADTTRWYTVKGDDNLWRIAESQLGSGAAWTQIRDMNKDVLKGGETVHANMRLRLPAKTAVAGAE